MLDISKLHELFVKIREITKMEDIAYHKFENGGLCPIYKLETDTLNSNTWKSSHSKMNLRIEDVWVLKSVFEEQKTFYMENTDENPDAPLAFKNFNIKTILVIPVIVDNQTIGMVDIGSIGYVLPLSTEQIKECEKLTYEFSKSIYE